jgi:protein-disulfide isomerase
MMDLGVSSPRWSLQPSRKVRVCCQHLVLVTMVVAGMAGCAPMAGPGAKTESAAGEQGVNSQAARPVADPRSMGRNAAPIVIVEYSDYQCPYCRKFHVEALPRLKSDYIDTGKVRLVFRDLPLAMHPESVPAAVAAHCAAEQGRFWAMNEALFTHQATLGAELYGRLAQTLKLDVQKFSTCSMNPATKKRVQASVQAAHYYEISGTPSFILGRPENGRVEILRVARGYVDFETFAREIDGLLATTPGTGEALSSDQKK